MCNSCSFQANYFHSIHCIYDHLVATHPVLWLRDSSRRWPAGYISRNFLNPAGDVLAIWNGKGKGWRLRKLKKYVSQLQMMVATLKIPLERRNKRTGRTEKARIWQITDRTVRTWFAEAVEAAAADGVTFSVPVTPHTFRHSYAMHMLYAGIPLKVLQSLMGHKSISSTEVYTKVFALDVAARHRVQFQMPGTEAVAMLKERI
ncbi:tyrosine-type recombinase/integrase [Klebsiella pneumoniae]